MREWKARYPKRVRKRTGISAIHVRNFVSVSAVTSSNKPCDCPQVELATGCHTMCQEETLGGSNDGPDRAFEPQTSSPEHAYGCNLHTPRFSWRRRQRHPVAPCVLRFVKGQVGPLDQFLAWLTEPKRSRANAHGQTTAWLVASVREFMRGDRRPNSVRDRKRARRVGSGKQDDELLSTVAGGGAGRPDDAVALPGGFMNQRRNLGQRDVPGPMPVGHRKIKHPTRSTSNSAHLQPKPFLHPGRTQGPLPHAIHRGPAESSALVPSVVVTSTRPRTTLRWVGLSTAG